MSGKIGCPHDEIEIIDSSPGFGLVSSTWTARCRGKSFSCSLGPDSEKEGGTDDMSCSEMSQKNGPAFEEFDLLSDP